MHQNVDEVGRKLTTQLLVLIDGEPVVRQRILIPTTLVVRDSAGPVPTR